MQPLGFIAADPGVLGFPTTARTGRVGGADTQVLYVSSTHASANNGNDGTDPLFPLATIAGAVDKAVANAVIYVAPGHVEDLADAQIDLDVAGISVIGLGHGSSRPRIDFNHANASIDIGANGVTVKNLQLLPSVTAVLIGIDVEAGVTDTLIDGVETLPGEDGAGVDEFALHIDIKAGCSRTTVQNCRLVDHASAAGSIAGVRLTGASDLVTVRNCFISLTGAALVAPINGITTLSTRVLIENNVLIADAEPGIELLTGTTGVARDNDIFADLATIAAAIVADGVALFRNWYVEVGGESHVVIGTPSAND